MEFRSSPRTPGARPRPRVRVALAVLATAGALALTACGPTNTGPGTASSSGSATAKPSASGSPSVNPGGPVQTVSPGPSHSGASSPGGAAPTAPGSSGGSAQVVPATGYSASGNDLTVYFDAGTCDKYGATADQSHPGEVLVRIVITQRAPAGQMCPLVITPQHATVDLGRPLDGRRVVDGSDSKALPQASGMPQSKVTHGPATQ
ncbi:hypothetical protein [Streptacidiphilus fuscans]|uniref:Lipoprotein n=1 Tax=Streptacidiphilus fuscans TaxID=2789292 RepID=A0A931FG98_9ACTN|nr:hypothetical protein [Streptacidiphilus fuscans]MBF9071075.1 hypothetical protein [Streptacidiphilus fuscans]